MIDFMYALAAVLWPISVCGASFFLAMAITPEPKFATGEQQTADMLAELVRLRAENRRISNQLSEYVAALMRPEKPLDDDDRQRVQITEREAESKLPDPE